MKKLTRWLTRLLASLPVTIILLCLCAITVLAATTSTVTVTFTPSNIALGVTTPNTWDAGNVADSGTAQTATGYFSTANTSNIITDIAVGVTGATWTGGNAFTHSDTATPGADTVGLKASANSGAFDIVVKNAATHNKLKDSLAASTALLWEAKFWAQTSHSDAVQKTNTIVLTATAH